MQPMKELQNISRPPLLLHEAHHLHFTMRSTLVAFTALVGSAAAFSGLAPAGLKPAAAGKLSSGRLGLRAARPAKVNSLHPRQHVRGRARSLRRDVSGSDGSAAALRRRRVFCRRLRAPLPVAEAR